jgi:adenylosuccinate lyase
MPAPKEDAPMTSSYSSPFSWRYGSPAMRALFSEETKRRMWRRMWLALAQAQSKAGLVSEAELADLRRYVDAVDIAAANAIEKEIHHDLMAELRVYAGQATVGGRKLHLGATSMDIEDNVDTARMRLALSMLCAGVREALDAFAAKIDQFADLTCMAYTHLQAAEPTTLGYRMSMWAHDLYLDYENLKCLSAWLPSKGLRGAVGTAASFERLLDGTGVTHEQLEREVLEAFGLRAVMVTGQTYPRRLDYVVVANVAALAASCSKFAFDVRVLASSPFGELGEPFGSKQVGSSAMPFKRNPIMCERICSLARIIAANVDVMWHNAADNLLERTLDDSANRRSAIAETFLAADEVVSLVRKVIAGLRVDQTRIRANLEKFGPFAGTEALLMEAVKKGGDRQALHERLREACMRAWDALEKTEKNPLEEMLARDPEFAKYVGADQLERLMDATRHTGFAAVKAREFATKVRALEKAPQNVVPGM